MDNAKVERTGEGLDNSRIRIRLWNREGYFPGYRVDNSVFAHHDLLYKIEEEPAELELLAAEFARMQGEYEQQASLSIQEALREWRNARLEEDELSAETDPRKGDPL